MSFAIAEMVDRFLMMVFSKAKGYLCDYKNQ